jgi:hypothetical protein
MRLELENIVAPAPLLHEKTIPKVSC